MHRVITSLVCLGISAGMASAQSGEYWRGPLDIDFAVVRAAGNEADAPDEFSRRFGRVDYNYSISAFEVSNRQYAQFLNSVSGEGDPYGLWLPADGRRWHDEIRRFDNGRGGYRYQVVPGKETNPVVRVTHRSIFRMMNWMHNGMQADMATTDYGAYDTSRWGFDPNGLYTDSMEPEPGARYWLAREDEWYKAAYFDPNRHGAGEPGYWTYPTRHDEEPDTWYEQGANPENSAIYDWPFSMPAGTVPGTFSPWGVYDMAGNAQEILGVWYTDGEPYGIAYATRGSHFIGFPPFDDKANRFWAPAYFGGSHHLDKFSFRIVTGNIPGPASGSTLLVLTLTMSHRRRRSRW